MKFLYSLFSAAVRLWTSGAMKPNRTEIFLTYTKLKLLTLLVPNRTRTKIFGIPWRCASLKSLTYVFEEIFVEGCYRTQSSFGLRTILDVGANTGLGVLFFKLNSPSASVMCFEPNPEAIELLQANITSARLYDLTLVPKAVGKEEGSLSFYQAASEKASVAAGLTRRSESDREILVPVVKLSTYLSSPVDFMKLDVEGAEAEVLEGCGEHLRQIRELVIECSHRSEDQSKLRAILERLERHGFSYRLSTSAPRYAFNSPSGQDILIWARNQNMP